MRTKEVVKKTWKFIRKPTTPVHLLYGFFCAWLIFEFGWLVGIMMMGGFALWERWNDQELMNRQALCLKYNLPLEFTNWHGYYVPEGAMDFWESTVTLCIGLVPLGIMKELGIIIYIGWLYGARLSL